MFFLRLKIAWTGAVFVMCMSYFYDLRSLMLFHFIPTFVLPKTMRKRFVWKNGVFSARAQTIKINIGNICDVQIIKGDNYLQIIKANLQHNQALHWCVCFRGWSPGFVHCSASLAQEMVRGRAFDLKKYQWLTVLGDI